MSRHNNNKTVTGPSLRVEPVLPLARYRLRFMPRGTPKLPEYAGSAWRGAFGHALKRTVCVTRMKSCGGCLLYRSCPYPYLFETPPPAETAKMRRYSAAPHPFLIELEDGMTPQIGPDAEHLLGLTLFGRANQSLAYLIHAFACAGAEGIGTNRAPFELIAVEQADDPTADAWREIYRPGSELAAGAPRLLETPPAPSNLRLRFHTPLRLRRAEQYVGPDQFRFADLFGNLLRRISMLSYFHTDTPLETDFAGLTHQARAVSFSKAELHWKDWTRYSTRQQTTMEMGGLTGTASLNDCELAAFWPYLWLGQWTHAGKGTSMGLGRYTLEPAASLPKQTGADVPAMTDASGWAVESISGQAG